MSAVMLTLMQVPFGIGSLGWVCLVPFILVCHYEQKPLLIAVIAFLVSSVYWICNLWWIGLVTVPGYIAFCLYLGLYWPILVYCIRHIPKQKRIPKQKQCHPDRSGGTSCLIANNYLQQIPLCLSIPILFVAAETVQGILITGFSWRLLAHSQWANTALIQICDVTGAAGVSFMVAMVNGLIAELIIGWKNNKLLCKRNVVEAVCVAAVLILAVGYGNWRIAQTADFVEEGPLIGSVQSNIPSHVKELSENAEMIMDDLLAKSESCIEAGCTMVAWPETIVLATMNTQNLMFQEPNSLPMQFDRAISEHALGRAYILFGAHAADFKVEGNYYVRSAEYNSALMYRPNGRQDPTRYDKIHLVPFGEYIPFRESAPFIYNFFRWISPYDYDYSLTRGKEYSVFRIAGDEQIWRFGVLICYEDTDADTTRRMTVSDGAKRVDWLVNLSNDGWYVRYKDGKVIPGGELSQRTAISVFRAIENRIPIIRSVNTGISCAIDSVGRIRNDYIAGNLPKLAMKREAVGGWFVDRVIVDKRITLFSQWGKWLDNACLALVLLVIGGEFTRKITRRSEKNQEKTKKS